MKARHLIGSLIALAVLGATGSAMAIRESYWSDGTLQLKLVLVGVVVALMTLHLVWHRLRVLQIAILAAGNSRPTRCMSNLPL
jgi:hypothetical protein